MAAATIAARVSATISPCNRRVAEDVLDCRCLVSGTNVLYACVVDMENNLERISDGGFSRDEYKEHPERYKSIFSTKVYLSLSCRPTCFCCWILASHIISCNIRMK